MKKNKWRRALKVPGTVCFLSFLIFLPAKGFGEINPAFNRSYFEHCADENFDKVYAGMMQPEVQKLLGGNFFLPLETKRDGFTVAVDEERSGWFSIPNWMPNPRAEIDFFFSKRRVAYVRYEAGRVVTIRLYSLQK